MTMDYKDRLLYDSLLTQRDQAKESIKNFIAKSMPGNEPSPGLLVLLEAFSNASHGESDNDALWGIFAAYGALVGMIETMESAG